MRNNILLPRRRGCGADEVVNEQLDPEKKTSQWPNGVPLCVDHSAMLFPSKLMQKWVYERTLMKRPDDIGFKFFGKYTLTKWSGNLGLDVTFNKGGFN